MRSATILLASILTAGLPTVALAQEYRFENVEEPGVEVGRVGSSILVQAEGPLMCFECNPGTRTLALRGFPIRWITVQDSTLGVVFTEPSGVRAVGVGGGAGYRYNGDVDLRALRDLRVVEVRAITFNVWKEFGRVLIVTEVYARKTGEDWSYNPGWSDIGAPAFVHGASVMWINRVMYEDGSVAEADMAPVAAAWLYLTGTEMEELSEQPIIGQITD